jgi:hypothetical protein
MALAQRRAGLLGAAGATPPRRRVAQRPGLTTWTHTTVGLLASGWRSTRQHYEREMSTATTARTTIESVTAKIAQDQATSLRAVSGLVETRFIPMLLSTMPRTPKGKARKTAIVASTKAKATPCGSSRRLHVPQGEAAGGALRLELLEGWVPRSPCHLQDTQGMPTATNIQGCANGGEYIGMILATSKGSPLDNLSGERDGPARTRAGRNLAGPLFRGHFGTSALWGSWRDGVMVLLAQTLNSDPAAHQQPPPKRPLMPEVALLRSR